MNRQEVYEYFDQYEREVIDNALAQLNVPLDQQEDLPTKVIQAVEELLSAFDKANAHPSKALVAAQVEGDTKAEEQAIVQQVLESVDLTESLRSAGCTNQQLVVIAMHKFHQGRYKAQMLAKAEEAGFMAEAERQDREFQGKLMDGLTLNSERMQSVLNPNLINSFVQKQAPQAQQVDWTDFINQTVAQAKVKTPEATKVTNQAFDLEAELMELGL